MTARSAAHNDACSGSGSQMAMKGVVSVSP
jgi:hypothetical protein